MTRSLAALLAVAALLGAGCGGDSDPAGNPAVQEAYLDTIREIADDARAIADDLGALSSRRAKISGEEADARLKLATTDSRVIAERLHLLRPPDRVIDDHAAMTVAAAKMADGIERAELFGDARDAAGTGFRAIDARAQAIAAALG